ncbi:MAG TPA: DUF423 domain-containing protein [Lacunisphaera sp.]|nr:DUF423 domain-containing protein [Lacunisphaera sp.]
MQTTSRMIVVASGLLGFAGVALGAFGAHALKDTLAARGSATTWQTAVLYQLVHAVALLALAGWSGGLPHARAIGLCWTLGVLLFSGSLYWLALGGPRFLGPVTPLGGLLFLAGWLLVAWTAFRQTTS